MESHYEEFSTKFNDSATKKHINPFTMEQLEQFKPHIVEFAKKCKNQKLYEIDMYGNHIFKVYDHHYSENIIIILEKGTTGYQTHQKSPEYTEEELKALNEGVEGLYDD